MPTHRYKKVALGGTFDHFHIGHRAFFEFAFHLADHIVVGVTLPKLVEHKKYAQTIESYELRVQTLQQYFRRQKYKGRFTIIPLSDVYGSTVTDSTIEALIVTPMTKKGGVLINAKRKEQGLQALPIHICEMIRDENDAYVSSTRIREGNIDREGRVYRNILKDDYCVKAEQKTQIRNISAKYIDIEILKQMRWDTTLPIIIVGDVVTKTCTETYVPFSIAYIDGYSQRKAVALPSNIEKEMLSHLPGVLQCNTFDHIQKYAIEKGKTFRIQGEEDLLAVEAILALPLGSIVIFGNPFPPQGIAVLNVHESVKTKLLNILSFTK